MLPAEVDALNQVPSEQMTSRPAATEPASPHIRQVLRRIGTGFYDRPDIVMSAAEKIQMEMDLSTDEES